MSAMVRAQHPRGAADVAGGTGQARDMGLPLGVYCPASSEAWSVSTQRFVVTVVNCVNTGLLAAGGGR